MFSINHDNYDLAANWAAKINLRPLTAIEQAEFEAWLAADPRHLGAYGRAEAALALPDLLDGIRDDSALEEPGTPHFWNRRRVMLASGAVAAGGATIVFEVAEPKTLSTEIGQLRQVALSDGSVVSLNTNSEIAIQFSEQIRRVNLLKGEALFDVAKNSARPFVVSAGNTEVWAVGTSFSVTFLPQKPTEVLVKDGIVELKRDDIPQAPPVRATANVRAIVPPDSPIVTAGLTDKELVRSLEWQNGRIALENETLADAAEEFARYNELRIVVDPDVSNRTVTGLFASHDPIGFAKSVAILLKVRSEVKSDEVRIFAE